LNLSFRPLSGIKPQRHTVKVTIYTREHSSRKLRRAKAKFYEEGTVFVLRHGKTWETLGPIPFADAKAVALQKELDIHIGRRMQLPVPRPQKQAVAPAKTDLLSAIDRHIDGLYAEGEHKVQTVKSKHHILREFAAWVGGRSPEQIDRAVLMAYKDWLVSEGYAERSGNNRLTHIASFLHALGMRGILTKKDWRGMKLLARRTTKRAYSKAEITALRNAATEDERDVIEFLLTTGMRKNQACATKWSDISFLNKTVRVPEGVGTTSTKKARAATLGTELLARLQARRLRYPNTTWLFETSTGTADQHIGSFVERAAKRAGLSLEGLSTLHSLRKTFATRLLNAGYDMYKVSKLLGHSDIHTTELYASFDSDSESAGDDIERALAAAN
jgi:site-specific recombinase XerD